MKQTASKCNCETLKYANCDYSNKKYKTNYNVNHSAIDSDLCEILKNKIKRYIEATDYPLQPTYERYFGKVETTKQTDNENEKEPTISTTNTTSTPMISRIRQTTFRDLPLIGHTYTHVRNKD